MKDRYNWWQSIRQASLIGVYDPLDKAGNIDELISEQVLKLMKAVKIDGLPDTIPERDLKLMLFMNGWASITEINTPVDPDTPPGLYAVLGGLGGRNAYYMPTFITWAQPCLGSRTDYIDKDCVIVRNDELYLGITPMFSRYASQIVETDLTLRTVLINQRIQQLLSCPDDNIRKAADEYLERVEAGELGVMADNALIDSIKVSPYSTNEQGRITSLIELRQYLTGTWDNKIGLSANYNMKRESITSGEAGRDDDILIPFIDEILTTWNTDFEKVNNKYNTNISARLESIWKTRKEIDEMEVEAVENEIEGRTSGELDNGGSDNNINPSDKNTTMATE